MQTVDYVNDYNYSSLGFAIIFFPVVDLVPP